MTGIPQDNSAKSQNLPLLIGTHLPGERDHKTKNNTPITHAGLWEDLQEVLAYERWKARTTISLVSAIRAMQRSEKQRVMSAREVIQMLKMLEVKNV